MYFQISLAGDALHQHWPDCFSSRMPDGSRNVGWAEFLQRTWQPSWYSTLIMYTSCACELALSPCHHVHQSTCNDNDSCCGGFWLCCSLLPSRCTHWWLPLPFLASVTTADLYADEQDLGESLLPIWQPCPASSELLGRLLHWLHLPPCRRGAVWPPG